MFVLALNVGNIYPRCVKPNKQSRLERVNFVVLLYSCLSNEVAEYFMRKIWKKMQIVRTLMSVLMICVHQMTDTYH